MWDWLVTAYWILSIVIVHITMFRYPPKHRNRELEEWIIGLVLAPLICPFAIYDLWTRR